MFIIMHHHKMMKDTYILNYFVHVFVSCHKLISIISITDLQISIIVCFCFFQDIDKLNHRYHKDIPLVNFGYHKIGL